jgi:hypothetical protein
LEAIRIFTNGIADQCVQFFVTEPEIVECS